MSENCFSRIASTGRFLPKRAVSNEELAQDLAKIGVETSDEWIRTRTGIEQRYLASGEESTTYLASEAAKQALEAGGFSPDEIDLIIVATTTPDSVFPSTAKFRRFSVRRAPVPLIFRPFVPVLPMHFRLLTQ